MFGNTEWRSYQFETLTGRCPEADLIEVAAPCTGRGAAASPDAENADDYDPRTPVNAPSRRRKYSGGTSDDDDDNPPKRRRFSGMNNDSQTPTGAGGETTNSNPDPIIKAVRLTDPFENYVPQPNATRIFDIADDIKRPYQNAGVSLNAEQERRNENNVLSSTRPKDPVRSIFGNNPVADMAPRAATSSRPAVVAPGMASSILTNFNTSDMDLATAGLGGSLSI
jgi:hypothetical protein